MQDLALDLVEPHEVHTGPPLKLVKVPLEDIPYLQHFDNTIYEPAECALNPALLLMKILNNY